MNWPEPRDYSEAIQNPKLCFVDPTLKSGNVRTGSRGLPRVTSGQFATVYEVFTRQQAWAVRCFQRNVPGQQQRYESLHNYLKPLSLPALVSFEYLTKGIVLTRPSSGGRKRYSYPIVKMEWVTGQTLDSYVRTKLLDSATLIALAEKFAEALISLRHHGIAHGDLQHANILVQHDGSLRFVDYDAMFVPPLRGQFCPETGLRNFQHPARTGHDYDENIDGFSGLVILATIRALAYDPLLWRFHTGENLIFSEADFTLPKRSPVFQQLKRSCDRGVLALASELEKACNSRLSRVTDFGHIFSALPTLSPIPTHPLTSELSNLLTSPAPRSTNPVPSIQPLSRGIARRIAIAQHVPAPPVPASIRMSRKSIPVSTPARRTGFKPSLVFGLGCLGVVAAWLVFVVISLLIQSQQASNRAASQTQADIAEQKNRQLSAIKVPRPDESVEFDLTAYPNSWSPPIAIPRDYHLAAEIIGNDGAKVWRSTDGNTNNYDVMMKASGSVWNVWSNSFVKIYNPLGKRMPYMAGPWASSVQFESAERFPITIRILLEPARQNTTLDPKQRSALTSTPPAQSSPPTRRHQGIFGIISSVDYNRQTFTVISIAGTNVFNVTNKTRILRAGNPVALSDVMENEKANGAAVKNGDGSLDAIILELGETKVAVSGPTSGEIQTFNLQAIAHRDALQTMRQEWPHETFGYFDTKMSYGDITGDHKDEAAVWVHYRLSGEASTPSFSHVFVYTLKGGKVALIAMLKGGDRAYGGIESVKIYDGHLVLGRYKPETPSACMACYGFIETTNYQWDGQKLASTGVRVSKIERKSDNTTIQPSKKVEPEAFALAQTSPIAPPSAAPPPTFPGEHFPQTRQRLMSASEVQAWTMEQLQYAINEMYARHGADFRDTVIRRQFDRFQWYRPKPGTTYDEAEASFSSIETDNVKLLGSFRDTRAANPNSSTGPSDTIANAKMFEGTWSGMVYTEVRAVSTRTYQDDCTVQIGPDETWIVVTSGGKRAQAKVSRRGRSLFWTVTETTNTFAGPAKSRHSGSFTVSDDGWTAEYRGLGEAISGGPGPSKSMQFGTLRKLH